ncbi:MAG: YopX family protein [Planctomycetota bacterium]|jgi:uncharacterized phage protein (TIGR01671 family)
MTTPNRFRFRAWSPTLKVMGAPWELVETLQELLDNKSLSGTMTDGIYMQSTGLSDANGVEIFEGDVFQTDRKCTCGNTVSTQRAEVWFHEGCFGLKLRTDDGHTVCDEFCFESNLRGKVIGNIYEQPALKELCR